MHQGKKMQGDAKIALVHRTQFFRVKCVKFFAPSRTSDAKKSRASKPSKATEPSAAAQPLAALQFYVGVQPTHNQVRVFFNSFDS